MVADQDLLGEQILLFFKGSLYPSLSFEPSVFLVLQVLCGRFMLIGIKGEGYALSALARMELGCGGVGDTTLCGDVLLVNRKARFALP